MRRRRPSPTPRPPRHACAPAWRSLRRRRDPRRPPPQGRAGGRPARRRPSCCRYRPRRARRAGGRGSCRAHGPHRRSSPCRSAILRRRTRGRPEAPWRGTGWCRGRDHRARRRRRQPPPRRPAVLPRRRATPPRPSPRGPRGSPNRRRWTRRDGSRDVLPPRSTAVTAASGPRPSATMRSTARSRAPSDPGGVSSTSAASRAPTTDAGSGAWRWDGGGSGASASSLQRSHSTTSDSGWRLDQPARSSPGSGGRSSGQPRHSHPSVSTPGGSPMSAASSTGWNSVTQPVPTPSTRAASHRFSMAHAQDHMSAST